MRHLLWLLLALPWAAYAQCDADLSWSPPTEYTNGDPLDAASDLNEYRVYDSSGTVLARPASGTQSYTVTGLEYGQYTLSMTAVATNGVESAMSNTANWECVDMREPEPPSNFMAQLVAFIKDLWSRLFA